MIVENKAGASGQIAAGEVLRAGGDGHTLMLDAMSYAVNPSLYRNMPYDPAKAFTPMAVIVRFPNMLVVNAGFPAKDVAGLIAMAKQKPGAIAFASSGNGSAQHLAGELFRQKAGVDITHVPYKGGAPALNDVIGGQVPMFFANMASGLPHVYEWNAIFAPAGTPAPVVGKLAEAIAKAVQAPEFKERVAGLGGELTGYGPAEAGRFIREQTTLWASVVRAGNVKVE